MSKPKIVLQFGDVANDGTGRGDKYGMFDNGVWENVLGIERTPNRGPNNPDGLFQAEAFALWLRDRSVDVIIWTLWLTACALKRVKAMVPNLKVIALTDHPLNVDLQVGRIFDSGTYISKIEGADAIMVLTPREAAFYGGLFQNTHLVGLPFPHQSYERYRVNKVNDVPLQEKEIIRVGLGVGGPGWAWFDRNYLTTTLAFRQFKKVMEQQHGVRVEGVWLSFTYPPTGGEMLHKWASAVEGTTIQQRSDMQTYLRTLQSCDMVFSNITRDTPGRLVAECAFFGIPIVGSTTLALQGELFPTLAIDPFDIGTQVESAIELATSGVPESLIPNARKGLEAYNYESSRAKFREVLKSLGYDGEGWETVAP